MAIGKSANLLQRLNVSGCTAISDAGVGAIAKHCEELQSLSLKRCLLVSDLALKVLCRGSFLLPQQCNCSLVTASVLLEMAL